MEPSVQPLIIEELLVGTGLLQLSMMENQNPIHALDR